MCLQDSHECFVQAKVILEKVQFRIPVPLAVRAVCAVVRFQVALKELPFGRLYSMEGLKPPSDSVLPSCRCWSELTGCIERFLISSQRDS